MELIVWIKSENLGLQSTLRSTADREEKDAESQSELGRHHGHDYNLPERVQNSHPHHAKVQQRIIDFNTCNFLIDSYPKKRERSLLLSMVVYDHLKGDLPNIWTPRESE
jgi:hypothetical protein